MTDKYENNRTIEKARKMVETVFNKKTVKKKKNDETGENYGYKYVPIFDYIEFVKVIPDLMHLFNRVSGNKNINILFILDQTKLSRIPL